MRKRRDQLQPVDLDDSDNVAARISDPVAREVFETKVELGIERDDFMAVVDEGDDDGGEW